MNAASLYGALAFYREIKYIKKRNALDTSRATITEPLRLRGRGAKVEELSSATAWERPAVERRLLDIVSALTGW